MPASNNSVPVSSRATWIKLGIAIVTMAVALVVFRFVFAWQGAFFLTPFVSFLTVVGIAIALYYSVMWFLSRRGSEQTGS